jgi:hypothetical protein
MKDWRTGLALGTLMAGLAWAGPAAAEDFRWESRLAKGQTIEIKGVNGGIDARPADGDAVLVTADKRGRRDDPEEVEIEVVEHRGGVTICAVYPSWRKRNECAPGTAGRLGAEKNDVKVEFTVRVPEGVSFVGRTVNGGIEAESLSADAEAYTVNGGIRLSTRGVGRAETVNGSVRASLGRGDWKGELSFETVNGSVTVELPEGVGAHVEAATVNGSIETDFPLTVRGRFASRRLNGTIGDGGRELSLETVNGSIRLRKAR